MYKCSRCGELTETLPTHIEIHTELDSIIRDRVCTYDCKCGGDYDEAERCELCNEWYFVDELPEGVCEECLDKYKSIENILDFISRQTETEAIKIELNTIVLAAFTDDEINDILLKALTESVKLTNMFSRRLPERFEHALTDDIKERWADFIKEMESKK